ncbi:hypothetical protein Ocin01_06092 [Orchesella cincta]|uniref:Uncharacterized protein n=1 Tax=Orchesella cincta TaxID=48709 RepID=A0A1D2N5N3_ORCCI|nr:hypothetical protein Ocin01_06092 [Orchesella cincta]
MPPYVNIRVTGPKTLVPKVFSVREIECDVNWTWIQFLHEKCLLTEVKLTDQVVVRKASCSVRSSWEANLGDYVRDFINNYSRIRSSYTVRLTMKMKAPKQRPVIRPDASAVRRTDNRVYRVPDSIASSVKNHVRSTTPGSSPGSGSNSPSFTFKAPFPKKPRLDSPEYQPRLELEPLENCSTMTADTDDDDVRSVTTVMEVRDLKRHGINHKMLKPIVLNRIGAMSNPELLRIQNELELLVADQAWHRLIYRVPRAAHLLGNIFGIQTIPEEDSD